MVTLEDFDPIPGDSDIIEARRQKLIARLEKRKETINAVNFTSEKKSEEAALDRLIVRASQEAERGETNSDTVAELKKNLPHCCGRTLLRIQDALENIRKAAVASTTHNRRGFSFSKPVLVQAKEYPKKSVASENTDSVPNGDPTSSNSQTSSEKVVAIKDMVQTVDRVAGVDGSSVTLKNLSFCILHFNFSPSAVHMQNISNCRIYFKTVESSLLMYNVIDSSVFAVAQQIRLHDAVNVKLHVAIRGAVILEGCRGVELAPYKLLCNGNPIETPEGDQWRHPKDFDFLAGEQSPNWRILPEDQWETTEF